MLKTKCVYSKIDEKDDGLRVLASRFRGRGMPASLYDVWMPNLGPSEDLLRDVLACDVTWSAFSKRYRAELQEDGPVDARCRTIKNHGQKFTLRLLRALATTSNVTLLCLCDEDATECHRHILKAMIERA